METSVVPNQQIVVQFSDANISENDAQNAIDTIELKLKIIGVEDIKIGQDQNGQLKITYFSKTDIHQIEDILSGEESFKFAHNSSEENSNNLPEQRDFKDYKLNISEIQKNSNTNWDFDGVEIVELNHKSDRFINLKLNNSGNSINSRLFDGFIKVRANIIYTSALEIDNLSYKIPEIRAGPTT